MSSIPIYSELILRNEQFLVNLRTAETELQSSMVRMGAMGAQLGSATQIGSLQQAETGVNAQFSDSAQGFGVFVQEFGIGAENFRDSADGFRIYVQAFGEAVEEVRLAARDLGVQANNGVGDEGVAAGAQGGGGGGRGTGRYGRIAGILVAHAGLSALFNEIGNQSAIDHLYEEIDTTKQAETEKQINDQYRDSFRGKFASFLAKNIGLNISDPEELANISDQSYRFAKREDLNQKRFAAGQQTRRHIEIELAREQGGDAAGDTAQADETFRQQQEIVNSLRNTPVGIKQANELNNMSLVQQQLAYDRIAREQTQREADSADAVSDIDKSASSRDLRMQGRYDEADTNDRHAAIERRIRTAQEKANLASDTDRPRLQIIADDLSKNEAADKQEGDDEAAYKKKVSLEKDLSGFLKEEHSARLSLTKDDNAAEFAEFVRLWDEKIKVIQDSKIDQATKDKLIKAAKAAREAETDARDAEATRRQSDIDEHIQSTKLRTEGYGGVASVDDFAQKVKDDLSKAGNDPQARKNVLEAARANLQAMASGLYKNQEFGSILDYNNSVQKEAFGENGDALSAMQNLFKSLGLTENAADRAAADKAFSEGTQHLKDVVGNLLTKGSKLLILTD